MSGCTRQCGMYFYWAYNTLTRYKVKHTDIPQTLALTEPQPHQGATGSWEEDSGLLRTMHPEPVPRTILTPPFKSPSKDGLILIVNNSNNNG